MKSTLLLIVTLFGLHSVQAQSQGVATELDEQAFTANFYAQYERVNPRVLNMPTYHNPKVHAAVRINLHNDPLGYLYAYGWHQSTAGMMFTESQRTIARQFTYGPLGNPHSMPHITPMAYAASGFMMPGSWAMGMHPMMMGDPRMMMGSGLLWADPMMWAMPGAAIGANAYRSGHHSPRQATPRQGGRTAPAATPARNTDRRE